MSTFSVIAVLAALCKETASTVTITDVGVLQFDEDGQFRAVHDGTRRLIDSSSCASADYTVGCSASDPAGCPCTAFTDDERTQILDAHNERRELAASGNEDCATSGGSSTQKCPAATDMNALLWDQTLETIATYWAHQFGDNSLFPFFCNF